MNTTASCSAGSTQNVVLAAPPHMNSPAEPTTPVAAGPFDTWPTRYGFEHFYGFLAGETSQYEPRLYRDTTPIEPPRDPNYHLSEDLANQAVNKSPCSMATAPKAPCAPASDMSSQR